MAAFYISPPQGSTSLRMSRGLLRWAFMPLLCGSGGRPRQRRWRSGPQWARRPYPGGGGRGWRGLLQPFITGIWMSISTKSNFPTADRTRFRASPGRFSAVSISAPVTLSSSAAISRLSALSSTSKIRFPRSARPFRASMGSMAAPVSPWLSCPSRVCSRERKMGLVRKPRAPASLPCFPPPPRHRR